MKLRVIWTISLIFTVLAFGASSAHLLELYNKLKLSKADYLTVQQIYRGWAFLGIDIVLAFISILFLTIKIRSLRGSFMLCLSAAAFILLSLAIFFIFVFPVNQVTNNWTSLPDNWEELRLQWEYAHAVNAVIYFFSVIVLGIAGTNLPKLNSSKFQNS